VATCPQGQQSSMWRLEHDNHGNPTTHIEFTGSICQACPVRPECTKSTKRGRQLNIRREESYTALQAARERQTTAEFKAQYAQRSGIEGTLSYAVRMAGMRRSRYRGLDKTRLQELFLATALNITRVSAWLAGKRPVVPKAPALVRLVRMTNAA
jgi:transposase